MFLKYIKTSPEACFSLAWQYLQNLLKVFEGHTHHMEFQNRTDKKHKTQKNKKLVS